MLEREQLNSKENRHIWKKVEPEVETYVIQYIYCNVIYYICIYNMYTFMYRHTCIYTYLCVSILKS